MLSNSMHNVGDVILLKVVRLNSCLCMYALFYFDFSSSSLYMLTSHFWSLFVFLSLKEEILVMTVIILIFHNSKKEAYIHNNHCNTLKILLRIALEV